MRPRGRRGTRPDGQYRPPRWWRLAIPEGHEVICSYTAALARFDQAAALEDWTADHRHRWRALFAGWLRWQHDQLGTITATRARVVEAAAAEVGRVISEWTVTRLWRWARNVGLAVEIEAGASGEFLSTRDGTPRGNRAATYAVVAPLSTAAPTSDNTPVANPSLSVDLFSTRKRVLNFRKPAGTKDQKRREEGDLWITPRTRADRRATAAAIVDRCRWSGRVAVTRLADALKPWFDQGWCGHAVIRGLDVRPDSTAHPGPVDYCDRHTGQHRTNNPIGVALWRLTLWTDQQGRPLAPPIARVIPDVADYRARLAQRADAQTITPPSAAATSPPAEWLELRHQLPTGTPPRNWHDRFRQRLGLDQAHARTELAAGHEQLRATGTGAETGGLVADLEQLPDAPTPHMNQVGGSAGRAASASDLRRHPPEGLPL